MSRPTPATAVVLHGAVPADAPPDELDVLAEASLVEAALDRLGCRVERLALTPDLAAAARRLRRLRPDLVFNLVESLDGDGRMIHLAPTLLESLGLPFTGAGAEAMFLTSCKPQAKHRLAAAGLPTPAWTDTALGWSVPPGETGRWIVKSAWEHASIGLDAGNVVPPARLAAVAAERRAGFGGDWFAERFVDGREFNLSLLAGADGPDLLPPAEIDFVGYGAERPRLVDYAAKWLPEAASFHDTPRRFEFAASDGPLLDRLAALAHACWRLFGLRGHARVDFRVDGAGEPWILEVNANPCLSPDAGFMAAARQAGLDVDGVVARILGDVNRPAARRVAAPAAALDA